MAENVPGYTAFSGGWRTESCDLGVYAGRSIHLAFRNVTDGSVPGDPEATIPPGFWLRNLSLGGSPVSPGSSLAGWLSPSQVRPTAVHGFTVQLVAAGRGRPKVYRLPLNARHDAVVPGWILRPLNITGAIVMYDEPTETVTESAPYALRVNGVLQPGG